MTTKEAASVVLTALTQNEASVKTARGLIGKLIGRVGTKAVGALGRGGARAAARRGLGGATRLMRGGTRGLRTAARKMMPRRNMFGGRGGSNIVKNMKMQGANSMKALQAPRQALTKGVKAPLQLGAPPVTTRAMVKATPQGLAKAAPQGLVKAAPKAVAKNPVKAVGGKLVDKIPLDGGGGAQQAAPGLQDTPLAMGNGSALTGGGATLTGRAKDLWKKHPQLISAAGGMGANELLHSMRDKQQAPVNNYYYQ